MLSHILKQIQKIEKNFGQKRELVVSKLDLTSNKPIKLF